MKIPKCPNCKVPMYKHGKSGSGKQRWECAEHGRTTNPNKPITATRIVKVEEKIEFKQEKILETIVITWAQNATPIHRGFVLGSLKAFCRDRNATLLVRPGRYKNATSRWTASQENEQWWAPELTPFLHNQRTSLNKNLVLMADVPIQPTDSTPLSGLESLSHGESAIFGHPKLQMNVIPTPHQRLPKILTTTGACTVQNYTDTKVGIKGDFHHVIGAVVVELVHGGVFHIRHINARADGAFCDLEKAYYPDGSVTKAGAYPGLVFGDAHPRFADPAVVEATFGSQGLVERLNPKKLVYHDLLDSYAVNPHHFGNPFIGVAKQPIGYDNMWLEVEETIDWLKRVSGQRQAIVVPSNHDDMFARWMKTHDWRLDPQNAEFYLETALHMVRGTRMEPNGARTPDPFVYWLEKRKLKNVQALHRNESYTIAGIECGLHGHEGPNGARGSLKNLSKLGAKVISGHSHTPGIEAGHYKAGTMTYLSLEYTGPISSWLNAHVSIDPMGKRHIHICVNGSFWK
jgi:hypothetical protein